MTDYDQCLAEYHELEQYGEVEKGYAKEYARQAKNMPYDERVDLLEDYRTKW